jgi:hypothetical protein
MIYKSGGHHRNEVFLFSAGYKFNSVGAKSILFGELSISFRID